MNLPITYTVRIDRELTPTPLQQMLISGDAYANQIRVLLYDASGPYEPGGTCAGFAVRKDGATVAITGTVSGNALTITLPPAAYAVEGPVNIGVKSVKDNQTATVFLGTGTVTLGETGTSVDPGTIIPSVTALIAAIDEAVASIPEDYSVLSAMVDALTHVDLPDSGYIDASGAELPNAEYVRSGYIPVSADSVVILDGFFTGTTTASAYAYTFYTAAKARISGANGISTRTVITSIPSGAAWVRFSSRISQGETPVAYVANHVVDRLQVATTDELAAYLGLA